VVFSLGGEEYALPIESVSEIILDERLIMLLDAAAFVAAGQPAAA
jgi:hypothetical protein